MAAAIVIAVDRPATSRLMARKPPSGIALHTSMKFFHCGIRGHRIGG
jgi:hypothetical protein